MKIVFMGTPEFAVPLLKTLILKYDVAAVFTQPDKPRGRGHKLSLSPVKEMAQSYSIPIYQPLKIKNDEESISKLCEIAPDFIIVAAFGQILPKKVLGIPRFGCINLHASLLPKYRGAAPINYAIINGETKSGITTMLMDEGLDTGDILLQKEYEITNEMNFGMLHDIFMNDGGELVINTIEAIVNNTIKPIKQNGGMSSYASMINKETCKIDWNKKSSDVHNLIRGMSPYPLVYTCYKGNVMKIIESEIIDDYNNCELKNVPGRIADVSKNGIKVETKDGIINLITIQFSGKKALLVRDYLNGNSIDVGEVLGEN